MTSPAEPIILFHYFGSPYARRIVWYLTLRQIPYLQCMQSHMLPRPDLTALGISYRRIPLLSIGKDVYLDTRLILQKLEALYPPSTAHPSIASESPDQLAIERLLSHYFIDAGIFGRGAQLIPADSPMMRDPKFVKDRAELNGVTQGAGPFSKRALESRRPEALCEIQGAMELLETTLLHDGREWVLGTSGPTLADIEAVWVFSWLMNMPGALPPDVISEQRHPKVFAYVQRFHKAVDARKKKLGKPKSISGQEMAKMLSGSKFVEDQGGVDTQDPWVKGEGLQEGDVVKLWPTDYGANHKDEGKLLSITRNETVIETEGEGGVIRIHAPRHGFKVRRASKVSSKM